MRPTSDFSPQALEVLSHEPSLELALLFGSRARGSAGPGSDFDVAVVGRGLDLTGLAAKLSLALGAEVDLVSLDHDPPIPLLRELLRDARCIYERNLGAEASFRARALWAIETDGPRVDAMAKHYIARTARRGAP
jgi:predicted nucleotidyltransferase